MHIAQCHSSTLIRLWPWERKRPKFENKQPKIQRLKTEILECVSGLYDKKRVGRVVSEPIIAPGGGSQCTFVNIHSAHSWYNFKNVKSRWKLRCDGGAGVCAIRAPHQEAIPCQHCDVIRSVQHFASKLAFMPLLLLFLLLETAWTVWAAAPVRRHHTAPLLLLLRCPISLWQERTALSAPVLNRRITPLVSLRIHCQFNLNHLRLPQIGIVHF